LKIAGCTPRGSYETNTELIAANLRDISMSPFLKRKYKEISG
jgi:hypothetical protein